MNQYKQQCESSLPPKGDVDVNLLKADPGLRKKISSFHPNVQDEVRRVYIQRGPCQPKGHSFPFREIGGKKRRFIASWFDDYWWLEYSIEKDAAYCLPCFLFKKVRQSDEAKKDYRTRLEASLNCIKFLLHNGLPFRGHDESEFSSNKGCFSELLEFHARDRDSIQCVVLENAPQNQRMTSPDIQKDIVHAIASAITKAIIKDLENDFFCILVDEARDVSIKEQMAIVLRFVDQNGSVVERFLGISHAMLVKNALSLSRIRGQGYDGASNMKGEINGLKSLILAENPSAHYVHYFVNSVSHLINVVGSSCKRQDSIKEHQAAKDQDIVNAIQLVRVAKLRLQGMRDQGWELLFHDAVLFCNKENIHVPSMNDVFVLLGRPRRNSQQVTNLHHYQVEVFYTAVDM
ncbi:Zinc finger MYM-type protein 1 [Linum perenne]